MKCLAHTQGPKVRVNAVLPGLLLTEWVCPLLYATSEEIANGILGPAIHFRSDRWMEGKDGS